MSELYAPLNTSQSKMKNDNVRKGMTILALIVLYFVLVNIPTPEGLTPQGQKSLALIMVATLCWVFELLPLAVSAVFFFVMQPVIGTAALPEAAKNFAQPIFFFVIASFMLANGLMESGLSKRFALQLAIISKGVPNRLLGLFMISTAILSAFIADVPVVAMMFPIALTLLKQTGCEPGKSNYGKAIMLGIPIAALIGGVGTPAGTSSNILTLGMLDQMAQIKITFLQWSLIGLPIVLVLTPIAWKILSFAYPSEIKELKGLGNVKKEYDELGPMSSQEKKYLIIILLLIATWLTESIHKLPIPVTATIGATVLFLPGINVLKWENTKNKIGWEVVILTCVCASLGMAIWNNGAATWIASGLSALVTGMSPIMVLTIMCFFIAIIHLLIPVNPALVAITMPIAVSVAAGLGINPSFLAIPVGFMISCACLLPLDAVPLLTYPSGYYKMYEMFKPGVFILIAWVFVAVIAMYLIARPLGLM